MPRRHDPRDARRGAAGHQRRSSTDGVRARDVRGAQPTAASLAYGIHPVRVLLQRSPQRVRQVWLSSSRDAAARLQELRSLAQQAQIAVVDADDTQLDQLADGERHQGVIVELAPRAGNPETQPEEALESLKAEDVDVVLTDRRLPGMDGVELVRQIKAEHPDLAVVVMTAALIPARRAARLEPGDIIRGTSQ